MRGRDVTRLKDLLGPVGKNLRLEDPSASATIWRRWPEIVGADIASNAEPTSLKDGVLRIRTTSPTWATEMSYLATDMKERINRAVGKPVVRDIKVWTSPAPITRARGGSEKPLRTPDRKPRPDRTDDPETAFQRAFQAWSKRRQKRSP